MVTIKQILDEIAAESSTKKKVEILGKYKDNDFLKRVMYLAKSRRIKFYIKQIPEYTPNVNHGIDDYTTGQILAKLADIYDRTFTGGAAIKWLKTLLEGAHPDDAYVIERIIDKDLKIGMGTSLINKVFKDLIEKTPYMGAISFKEDKVKKLFEGGRKVFSQVKMDGRYCNAIIQGGEVELVSRQGETTYVGDATFLKELSILDDCVLNGELTINGIDRYTANGIVASIVDIEGKRESRGETATAKKIAAFEKKHGSYQEAINNIRYTVWDIIDVSEYFDKKSLTIYENRLDRLTDILRTNSFTRISLVETTIVKSFAEAMTHFQSILALSEEGTILKAMDGIWKNGKPTFQIKMKLEITLDLKIVGFNYGTKGTKNENVISSLNVETECGGLSTSPGGMDELLMTHVTENQEELLGTIVEIKCCGVSKNRDGEWSTLHPSVIKLRDDKIIANTFNECVEIDAAAKGLVNG